MGGFLILVVVAAVLWLLFVLPRRRSQQQHAAMQDSVDVGDEIITAGGLHAFVREIGDDQLKIEIAPGVIATLDRRAVAAVAREVEVEVEPESGSEADPQAG
jgi:preprotein translocase subunit YajC